MTSNESEPLDVKALTPKGAIPLLVFSLLFFLAGVAEFLVGVFWAARTERIWQAFLLNYIFWAGLSFGSILLIALFNMTKARWSRPMKRLTEALGASALLCFLLFWLLYWGKERLFPWITTPDFEKIAYLNVPFLFARDGVGLFLLTLAGMALLYVSIRSDRRVVRELRERNQVVRLETIASLPQSTQAFMERHWNAQMILSYVYAILYTLVMTLIAWDIIMSLAPEFYSTLFGAYYFTGCIYSAAAALAVLLMIATATMGLGPFILPRNMVSLGKFILGFLLVYGDFFFSQFLLIWYGNKPDETRYLIARFNYAPWSDVVLACLGLLFALPFFVLLIHKVKLKPLVLMGVGILILLGMWLDRFLLVAPSLWQGTELPLGVPEALLALGFLGLTGFCAFAYLGRYPLLPVSDPLFREAYRKDHVEG